MTESRSDTLAALEIAPIVGGNPPALDEQVGDGTIHVRGPDGADLGQPSAIDEIVLKG